MNALKGLETIKRFDTQTEEKKAAPVVKPSTDTVTSFASSTMTTDTKLLKQPTFGDLNKFDLQPKPKEEAKKP